MNAIYCKVSSTCKQVNNDLFPDMSKIIDILSYCKVTGCLKMLKSI